MTDNHLDSREAQNTVIPNNNQTFWHFGFIIYIEIILPEQSD